MAVSFLGEWDYKPDQLRTFVIAINGQDAQNRVSAIQNDLAVIRQKISDIALRLTADDCWVSEEFADHAGWTGKFERSDPGFKHTGESVQLKDGSWREIFDTVAMLVAEVDPDNTFVAF